MTICARRGCGFDFDASTKASSCSYHPGRPVFRDQSKSWSCCADINKPVLDFDDFVAIKGCQTAPEHTDEKQPMPPEPNKAGGAESVDGAAGPGAAATKDRTEAIPAALTGASLQAAQNAQQARVTAGGAAAGNADAAARQKEEDEEDPEDAVVAEGAECKRTGCKTKFEGGSRQRSEEVCRYHPKPAIFHEGSKGYICCKRRVLEFSEFLTIEPCTTSTKGHLYVGQPKQTGSAGEEPTECRMDHYETPADIRLTVYAKGADMDKSRIAMQDDSVHFSVWLPPLPTSSNTNGRRFERKLALFSDIDTASSSYTVTKFKIDLILVKRAKGVSWPSLERSDRVFGYGVTFGRAQDAQTNGGVTASGR